MDLLTITGIMGGVGLFLLGMQLMTDGLRLAAGEALRNILQRWTGTPLRGLLSGFTITALVQSSSAVTVATLGFVNAGLINLKQAVTVIYGSNVGTTMTAWLVALIGFNVNIKLFALPAIGIGMALRLLSTSKRLNGYGNTLAGFGVFFLGIEILKSALGDAGRTIDFSGIGPEGMGLVILVLAGFGMTLLLQSSSAAMAIVITAAGSDIISLNAAAAMVIGANIGTTSTALLAVIGATPNAKRVAGAHLIFNLITGLVALMILPLMLSFSVYLRDSLGLAAEDVTLLALFHTLFNLLGVALVWPWTHYLTDFLSRRFRTREEDESCPRYLDNTLTSTPSLAIHALIMELGRIAHLSHRVGKWALSSEEPKNAKLEAETAAVEQLAIAISQYSANVQQNDLSDKVADALPNAPRIARYYITATRLSEMIADQQSVQERVPEKLFQELTDLKRNVVALIETAEPEALAADPEAPAKALQALESQYQQLKSHILQSGTRGEIGPKEMVAILELTSNIHRLAQQVEKASRYMEMFKHYTPAETVEEPASTLN